MASSARFRRADRIVSPRDYARIQKRGRRLSSRNFAVSLTPSAGGTASRARLGLSVSRRVGKAVVRNRIKRVVREWFRSSRRELQDGGDIVVSARPGAANCAGSEIAAELSSLVSRLAASTRPAAPSDSPQPGNER